MEIIVEVGDEGVRHQIEEELQVILAIAEAMDLPATISRILVPLDFQAKVRELTGDKDYKFQRGLDGAQVTVAAKILEDQDGIVIVISPILYLQFYDTMIRAFVLTHEFTHIKNKSRFPQVPKGSFALENNLVNLYYLFDEYSADRLAFLVTERLFTPPSEAWKQVHDNEVLGYIDPVSHPKYYAQLKSEIAKFRIHADVSLHWKTVHETLSVVSISTVHGFASYHQHPDTYSDLVIPTTPFVNQRTLNLMEYFKSKFEKKETDLQDGIQVIDDYLTNFGIRFEDRPGNLGWIEVLDI